VLHAFQKKSKKGIATPKQTIELIKSRLRDAEEDYRARKNASHDHAPEESRSRQRQHFC
jgi:hypothetical protein